MSEEIKRDDPDSPTWTDEMFARAKGPESLSAAELAAFPRTRGPAKAPLKVAVSLRLDPDIVEHYRGTGRGWQSRINDDLKSIMSR